MKKFTKLLLVSAASLCLLTGCYQEDVTVKFKHSGAEFNAEIYATDAAYNYYCNDDNAEDPITHSDILDSNIPQLQEMITDDTVHVEQAQKDIDGETYYGLKADGKFKSVSEMLDSQIFKNLNMAYLYADEEGLEEYIEENHMGICFKENVGAFGTSYKLKGYASLTQDKGSSLSDEELAKLEKAKSTLKLKFPVLSFSFSKGCKLFMAPSFEYALNNTNLEMPIDIAVFVPNFAVLGAVLIIILMLIIILLLLKKIKSLTPAPVAAGYDSEVDTLSEDDENFFEGNDENNEFEEITEEAPADEPEENSDDSTEE